MPQDEKTVVDILVEDHREVESMFGRLEQLSPSDDEHRQLVERVIIELVRHSVAEEQYLYPATRQYVPDGGQLADREISEHNESEETMKELELATDDAQVAGLVASLVEAVREHIREEEETLFPLLARHTERQTLVELGEKIAKAKTSAPTRPHPSAPSERPALLKAMAPGTGLVDRARDALSGRGKH